MIKRAGSSCLVVLLLAAACRQPPPAVAPAPLDLDRPEAMYCSRHIPTRQSPASLLAEARAAVRALGLRPALVDSGPARARIAIGGPTAPNGTGSAALRAARLYLDWRAAASPDGVSGLYEIYLGSGVWTAPATLTAEERSALEKQVEVLGDRFMRAMPSTATRTPMCVH